ncbi:ankyrin repeat domain-containing protein [Bordetella petrii]|uniref:ankyrin repeat domain-containing protein n=1 Tax=Bordetella petrii TaxID=94624 RepID=UPI001E507833|nr:ankyrin repeat domain-containing protein [Bordetella petrii]MCD0502377.1 ankyrin repeat domain-containing protein [Bordetella petrii]
MKLVFPVFSGSRQFAAAIALGLAAICAGPAAQAAASQENWWVYVHNDNAPEIRELLAGGADPNVRYKNGQPALMRAVVDGAWEVFDALAADPRTQLDAVNPANETALMYLAVAGQTARARTLISRGAQVNRLGWTPLHYAASKGRIETAKLLLANKAMVNAPSPDGTTPIMMAGFSGNRDMVQLLLDAGADITTRDLKDKNASDWAYAGKQGKLGAELAELIAAAQGRRDAARQGQSAAPAPVAAPAPQAQPAPAPSQAQPGDASPSLSGVSGVRLNKYD